MAHSAEMMFEKPKISEDDWIVVLPRRNSRNRKFPKIKSPKQQEEQTHWAPTDVETNPERESRLMQRVQICIEKLETSQFFSAFLDQMHCPETLDYFCKHRAAGSEEKLKMVIYGIGSIESFEPPRLQLSLAILMKRKLDWIGDIEVFDPIISLTESKVLEELGCCVLSVNEQGRRLALNPILFFMPHCEAELYDNLLKSNWRWDRLNQIVLLGNSFVQYEQQRSMFQNTELDDSRKHLLAVGRFTKEFKIRTFSDDDFLAFQGSSWHIFRVDPKAKLQIHPLRCRWETVNNRGRRSARDRSSLTGMKGCSRRLVVVGHDDVPLLEQVEVEDIRIDIPVGHEEQPISSPRQQRDDQPLPVTQDITHILFTGIEVLSKQMNRLEQRHDATDPCSNSMHRGGCSPAGAVLVYCRHF